MLTRLLQAAIMAVWAVFFLWLFAVDQPTLARLLHPRLWWLVLGGAMVLISFCGLALSRLRMPPAKPLRWTWPTYLALLVPLCYFWPMQSARFNSQTFFDRATSPIDTTIAREDDETNQTAPAPTDTTSNTTADTTAPIEATFSQIVQDPQQFAGRKVEVLCQTLTDPRLSEDQFICYRFRITCCAADAQPVFVFVNRQGFPTPAKDAWVRVQGKLSTHRVDNITFPLLQAESVQQEAEPSFPFIF
jgi:uncharacterized repeat protein (TIGR03943 family)